VKDLGSVEGNALKFLNKNYKPGLESGIFAPVSAWCCMSVTMVVHAGGKREKRAIKRSYQLAE
jgi:hypothetical protein